MFEDICIHVFIYTILKLQICHGNQTGYSQSVWL